MSLFGTKKPSSEPVVPEAVVEHKQSIGNQVMEALGVGEGANEYNKVEETEVMMPAKNQSQLAAEEMVKQHENICVISKDAIIRGGIEAKDALVVAGHVIGPVSTSTLTCVGDSCYIEGPVVCDELQMHGGKIKGDVTASRKADINGTIEGNIACGVNMEASFGEHAVVSGNYIQCSVLRVEPGAQIAAKIQMGKNKDSVKPDTSQKEDKAKRPAGAETNTDGPNT